MFDILSTTAGFLLGSAVGATGMYYASKCTDQRRRSEGCKQAKEDFLRIKEKMSEFFAELRQDLRESSFVREFFVIPKRVTFGGSEGFYFLYRYDENNSLLNKMQILENMGYISDVTPTNAPKFRMTEEFVNLVISYCK